MTIDPSEVDLEHERPNEEQSLFASISVVIPCYNCEATLSRAFGSVLNQTVKPAEIILVDDASTDGTRSLLADLVSRYPDRVTAIYFDTNRGPSAARNAAWTKATQRYIAFLDADDTWHRQKLEIQHAWMAQNPGVHMCGHLCAEYDPSFNDASFLRGTAVKKFGLLRLLFSNPFSTPSVMLVRDIPQRFPEDKRYCEDYHLWLAIAAVYGPLFRIEIFLACYHKPAYGASGLSGALWPMELGELSSFAMLRTEKRISRFLYWVAGAFSLLKFLFRLLRVRLIKIKV